MKLKLPPGWAIVRGYGKNPTGDWIVCDEKDNQRGRFKTKRSAEKFAGTNAPQPGRLAI